MASTSMFYIAHWCTFVTGTMRFGTVDVTEGQVCIMGLLVTATIAGPGLWDVEVAGLFSLRVVPTMLALACAIYR